MIVLTKDNERDIIKESLNILNEGGIIAYPTESFYALGVKATNEEAIKRLFKLKGRPLDKPLPVIVGDMDTLRAIVRDIPSQAEDLISRYWPGPLTLIFEARDVIPSILTGGIRKIAVRIPGEGFSLHLASAIRFPITSTSANPSSMPPARSAGEVKDYFGGGIDLIVDGGETHGGLPSTIVDVTCKPPIIVRQGRLSIPPQV
ncbi:MAG: hypothetical protein Fur0020_07150 [Thermodesulfovibrionia bacterium]